MFNRVFSHLLELISSYIILKSNSDIKYRVLSMFFTRHFDCIGNKYV